MSVGNTLTAPSWMHWIDREIAIRLREAKYCEQMIAKYGPHTMATCAICRGSPPDGINVMCECGNTGQMRCDQALLLHQFELEILYK